MNVGFRAAALFAFASSPLLSGSKSPVVKNSECYRTLVRALL